jgi:serine O-acetyltransferase
MPGSLVPRIAATFRRDLRAARERDPAAHSNVELLLYQGLHAVWMHRAAHALYLRGLRVPARAVSQLSRFLTGIEIHPGARIGPGVFIDHGMGVVIGETAEVGHDVTIYQGVTLGGTGKQGGKRPLTVGDDAKIGAGSIVIRDVPPRTTVVGNPGRPVIVDGQRVTAEPELEHTRLPDPVAEAMQCLVERVAELEEIVSALREGREPPVRPERNGDCLPDATRDIAGILGLNTGAGI